MSKCQRCEKEYKVDIVVPDDLWERIKPQDKPKGAGLLCGPCIMYILEYLIPAESYKLTLI